MVNTNGVGRKTCISGILYRGQPVYEEWSEDRTTLNWYSREVEKDDKGWCFKRWLPLNVVSGFVPGESHAAFLAKLMTARNLLLKVPGVWVEPKVKRVLKGTREFKEPEPGDVVLDALGKLRCIAYGEGFVMARSSRSAMPVVISEKRWNSYLRNDNKTNYTRSSRRGRRELRATRPTS